MIFRFLNYSALGKTRWEMALSLMHEIFGKVNEIFGNLIHPKYAGRKLILVRNILKIGLSVN